eukprot:CAMPEP_0179199782 /NCGR_PEP_ID=MMETSP0796-20121207/99403_1 /TAXON_ID=73915 /ORGANISM="Pyrodinium bahamense, Strain pbaha01" /LENGTH=169 /DNA_ID=CAMNT_0020904295 /DNA_START=380 /DNA_END=886 /DNA_ORIENTATION=-
MADDMISGRDATTIYDLAGQGAFEIRPGNLTLTTEFGLSYCARRHSAGQKKCDYSRVCSDYNAHVPTCHCDVLNFVEFAGASELEGLGADLAAIGWTPKVQSWPWLGEDELLYGSWEEDEEESISTRSQKRKKSKAEQDDAHRSVAFPVIAVFIGGKAGFPGPELTEQA